MPVKRNKHNIIPNIPNFDELMNHPLTVLVEDSFGNEKKMYMDAKLHLVPAENMPNEVDLSNEQKNMKNNFQISSLSPNKINTGIISENRDNNKKLFYSPKPLTVQTDNISKTKVMKRTLNFLIVDDNDENDIGQIKSDNTEDNKVFVETRRKSILKQSNVDNSKNITVKRKSQVMFSSPIVRGTPNKKCDIQKNLLIEQLRRCQETPILPNETKHNNNNNQLDESSLQFDEISHKQPLTGIPFFVEDINNSTDDNIETSYQIVKSENRKKWLMEAKRRSRWIKRTQGVNDSFWDIYNVDDSESVLLKLCETPTLQSFAKIFPSKNRKQISKIGEGSFGEVFCIVDSENQLTVAKFVPIQGDLYYNGGPQTTFDDIISEIVVAKELSDINFGTLNKCKTFVQMKSVSLAIGKLPSYFQKEWDKNNKLKSSENDNPKKFGNNQKWIIIQFEYAGSPLENYQIESWKQAYSILIQTCLAIACAENYLEFEHRDLHWGNLLILKKTSDCPAINYIVDGKQYLIDHHGVQSTIIDFTFSRIKKGINLVYTDMSKDKDIFLGIGDIQFDVYRQMQIHNKNKWDTFNPKSNIFWISYLGSKLQEMFEDKKESLSDDNKEQFISLINDVVHYNSVNDLIKYHIK